MSFGKKTPAYRPVSRDMLPFLGQHFKHVSETQLKKIFEILTMHLHTETLLFVWIVDTLDRFLGGERDEASFGFGAGIKLSALSKGASLTNMGHKAQSTIMEYLHDVLVELPMAGENYADLQQFLKEEFGVIIALYHSCGEAIIPIEALGHFQEAAREDQYLRTWLDWETATEKNVPEKELVRDYHYSEIEVGAAKHCFDLACEAAGLDLVVHS